jgi:endonuclease/exonuclease/phosphatase family metal-dependent hydrolase
MIGCFFCAQTNIFCTQTNNAYLRKMKSIFYTLCLILCIVSGKQGFSQSITLMTYNIYHGELPYQKGSPNMDEVAAFIRKVAPHAVALQEVDSMTNRSAALNKGVAQDWAHDLGKKVGMQGYFAKAIDYSGGGYGEGLLTKGAVHPIRFNLPIPRGGEGRAFIGAEITVGTNQQVIFGGTHLCHQFAENRIAQVKALVSQLRDERLPVILAGDFNFTPDSEEYKIITEFFYDAATLKGFPENTYPAHDPEIRIDYFFLSKKFNWAIETLDATSSTTSDHLPLILTTTWSPKN